MPSLFLCTQPCIAAPHQSEPTKVQAQPVEQSDAFIRVNTPLTKGEFSVNIERLADREATRLTLIGKMWDPNFKGEGIPDDAWDAKLTFVFSEHSTDEIRSLGPLRSWKNGDNTELYSAEPLTPDAAMWVRKDAPELGSIEVWNTPSTRIADFAVISLFHAMILPELEGGNDSERGGCTPTFIECHNTAKETCNKRIGSFEYSCDQGAVTCKFTCLELVPE
ncbi:MAG: hypothetical protein JKX70_08190 [Phycisphaerales bacterium]|nr:hypothetical protein [Phycisphaerales bacterium]